MAEVVVVDGDAKGTGGSARDYLSVLRKRWWVVLLAVLIGGGVGAAVSYTATPLFQSTVSRIFRRPEQRHWRRSFPER